MLLIRNGVPLLPLGDNKPTINAPYKPETVTSNLGNTYDITPSRNHSTMINRAPTKHIPNSSVDILDKETGRVKTRRYYDSNGNVFRDVDMDNHGNSKTHPEYPHEYFWYIDDHGIIRRK